MFFAKRRSRRKNEKRDEFLALVALTVVNHIGSRRSADVVSGSAKRLSETLRALTAAIASHEVGDENDQQVAAFLEKYADTSSSQLSKRKVFASTVGGNLSDLSGYDLRVLEQKILSLLRSDGAESVLFQRNSGNSFTVGVVFSN